MLTGKIKFYDPRKGFGFLARDDGGEDVFVGAFALDSSNVRDDPVEGERFAFSLRRDLKGRPAAGNLRRLDA